MSSVAANIRTSAGLGSSEDRLAIPLHNILRHLALQPVDGEALFPNTWHGLKASKAIQVELETPSSGDAHYKLQHSAHAVFDTVSKKWRIEGEGDKTALKILGVIASKKHGARAIQLPNHTHKIVAGILSGDALLSLFGAPTFTSDRKKVILEPAASQTLNFITVVPQQYKHRSSGGSSNKLDSRSQFKHMEYVLRSSSKDRTESHGQNKHGDLAWTGSQKQAITVVNGSDVQDLAQYQGLLEALRRDFDEVENHSDKKASLEKRLLLLEHQIDGLLKRKIQFTSKDVEGGTRFLDYTKLINQKENEIITLHKKVDNLENRLKKKNSETTDLTKEIQRLNEVVKTINNPSVTKEEIDNLLLSHFETVQLHKQAQKLSHKSNASSQLFKSHLDNLILKGVKIDNQKELRLLTDQSHNTDAKLLDGVVHITETKDRLVEVPLQDEKTRQLLRMMGAQIYRIYQRYPKIKEEASPQFVELLNRQVLKVVDSDGMSRITQIVRYMPSLVKVENIYSVNNDKQRKIQFHLRVLLKALIQEFDRIKTKSGVTPELDEGVIKMVHDQIGDASVDDILKVFQVNHKIVEVPKIIEKVVDRYVQIPTVLPVEKLVQKVVQNTKIQQVQKIVHVPVEVIKYVDRIVQKIVEVKSIEQKIVEVPKIVEKIIEKRIEVPKIIEVEVIKERIVQVEKPIIIEKIVNHPVPEYKEIEVVRQQTVVVKQVVERIKQVQRIVEKIVERIVEKPVIIQVEKIVQKLVNTIQYKPAREVVNHVEQVPQIIERVVEKVIPIIQTIEKIKQVERIVEKIVQVRVEVPTIKQIKVIEERIVYQDRVKQVEKIIEKVVPLIREVIKEVQKRVQVPIIQQRILKVTETVEKIIPEKYQTIKIIEVEKIREKVVQIPKMMEVIKTVIKYITVEKPVKVIVQKIVQVPKIIERIKQIRVPIDKIIEKLVEVPKVVEVQKIVQKIVVVPRIVQKIVEVPQIVQKIVDRIIEVEKIVEVIKQIRIPIIQEKIVEVQIIKYIQVPTIKQIQVIVEKIVPAIQDREVIKPVDVVRQKIVEARIQVPKQVVTQKLVPQTVQIEKVVEVQRAIVIPFQMPVTCDKIVEKLVVVEKEVQKIVQVQVKVEKLVEVIKEVATVKEVTKIEEKPIIQEKIKQIEKIVPYISQKVKEVEVVREKPVAVIQVEERLKEIAAIHEKIVQVVHQVPKIYEVEKVVEKLIEVPRFIEITAKEPVIINNNRIVDRFIDKVVEVHFQHQEIVQVPTIQQKIVQVEKIVEKLKIVELIKDKFIETQKYVEKTNIENKIETKYETVDRFEEKLVPVSSYTERIVEVPHLLQKIVERIVLMPQIHQVTQHIIDIQEEANPGVAVDVDITEHQAQYGKLYKSFKKDSEALRTDLRSLKTAHPELSDRITALEKYVTELDTLSEFPKFVQITKDKIVNNNVSVPVFLSKKAPQSIKSEAFYLVLIEKLIKELQHAKQTTSYAVGDEQIKLLFLSSYIKDDKKLAEKLDEFKRSKQGQKYANVRSDDGLLSEVLYDKFYLAHLLEKSKLQTEKNRKISEQRLELLHRFKQTNDSLHQRLVSLEDQIQILLKTPLNKQTAEKLRSILKQIQEINELQYSDIKNLRINQPVQMNLKFSSQDSNYRLQASKIRELENQIILLRKQYVQKAGQSKNINSDKDKDAVIDNLRKTITNLIDRKGTQTTLHDDDRKDTITSLDKIGDRTARKSLKNETSIIGGLSFTPNKNRQIEWDEYPIIKQEDENHRNSEQFGYVILPHGKINNSTKSYKVIENEDHKSYILIPIGDDEIAHPGQRTIQPTKQDILQSDTTQYPYGNPWLPYHKQVHTDGGVAAKNNIKESFNKWAEIAKKDELALKDKHESAGKQVISNTLNQIQQGADPSITINAKHVQGTKTIVVNEIQSNSKPQEKIVLPEQKVPEVSNPQNGPSGGSSSSIPHQAISASVVSKLQEHLDNKPQTQPQPKPQSENNNSSIPHPAISTAVISKLQQQFDNKLKPQPQTQPQGQNNSSSITHPAIPATVFNKIQEHFDNKPQPQLQPQPQPHTQTEINSSSIPHPAISATVFNKLQENFNNKAQPQPQPQSENNIQAQNIKNLKQITEKLAERETQAIGTNSVAGGAGNKPITGVHVPLPIGNFTESHVVAHDSNLPNGGWTISKNSQKEVKKQLASDGQYVDHVYINHLIPSTTGKRFTIVESRVEEIPNHPVETNLQFNYHNPGTIVIPNLLDPNSLLTLPGRSSRVVFVDQDGGKVETFNQAGHIDGADEGGASYSATYQYKTEVKEVGEGQHRFEKKVTQIRTNQTVNWISRSRVVEGDRPSSNSPRKEDLSPRKEEQSPKKDPKN